MLDVLFSGINLAVALSVVTVGGLIFLLVKASNSFSSKINEVTSRPHFD